MFVCLYVTFFNFKKIQLAVLVDNTSLFILFGLTKEMTTTNTMLILDIRNISSLEFSETYPLSGSSGLSKGAIAGIAVGVVVLVS